MYVRTAQAPESSIAALRRIVTEMDATLPMYAVRTVEQQVARSLANERFVASLSSVLGVLATLLAMVGLSGVMSYAVARRTREIAIRVAFGADSTRVTALVVRDMLMLVGTGVLLALPTLWWVNRFVRSRTLRGDADRPGVSGLGRGGVVVRRRRRCLGALAPRAPHQSDDGFARGIRKLQVTSSKFKTTRAT